MMLNVRRLKLWGIKLLTLFFTLRLRHPDIPSLVKQATIIPFNKAGSPHYLRIHTYPFPSSLRQLNFLRDSYSLTKPSSESSGPSTRIPQTEINHLSPTPSSPQGDSMIQSTNSKPSLCWWTLAYQALLMQLTTSYFYTQLATQSKTITRYGDGQYIWVAMHRPADLTMMCRYIMQWGLAAH